MISEGILPNLTRQYILNILNEEDIISLYSGVPVYEILNCIENKELIQSPIRQDNDPTCGFYINSTGRLKMRDFNGYFWGDCFDLVAYRMNLDANVSNHHAIILDRVAKDFKIHKYKNAKEVIRYERNQILKKKDYVQFDFEFRNWNKYDAKYWKGLTKNDLETNKVHAVRHLTVNQQTSYIYRDNDLAYAYYLGQEKWKVYYPNRPKGKRFMCNSSTVQGINTLKQSELLIITKSYKDVVYLRKFKEKYNIDAIAPSSETQILNPKQIEYLRGKSNNIITFMDYDNTGIHNAWNHREKYGINPIFLSEGVWKRKKGYGNCKDFSDYVHLHGIDRAEELLINLIKPHILNGERKQTVEDMGSI